ncbi:MAG: aldehyde dehydrogenase family protein [Deltaproteobacteria bacterium]|nr:aldehyde dehydrogenase family protein [Deltaproteobacteria bacterium]
MTTAALQVWNPSTGQVVQTLEADTPESVQHKVAAVKAGSAAWASTPVFERCETLARFRHLVVQNADELAHTTTLETGKPISQARNEVKAFDARLAFFLEHAAAELQAREVHQEAGLHERITWEPLGVVANISAWNYPYFVGGNVFVPALLTGNAVVYKPSEFAANTGRKLVDLLWQAGVPKDALALVIGGGAAGSALLESPINAVFFTGSYATGVRVAAQAATHLLKVQLELGGKDPIYVMEDANVASAAEATADGAFYNAGQSCCAVERLYVHERIYDAFVEHFVKTVDGFVVGDPMDPKTYIGPLTRAAQLDVLEAQVADALAHGARVLRGGQRLQRPGFYFAPTVVADANHQMQLMREESFGPVIGIQKVSSDDEAAALMKDTPYGLTAGVYGQDQGRAMKLLGQMNTGSVYFNCCDRVSPRLPWSGRGHSGLGTTLSTLGIAAFLQPKAWHLRG